MSAKAQQDRTVVALAAVMCGRRSHAASVVAKRGECTAAADQYRVTVTAPGSSASGADGPSASQGAEVVLDHWGGDAELLEPRRWVSNGARPSSARELARIAARALSYYELDSLEVAYHDGSRLSATPAKVVIVGPRSGPLHRRARLLVATLDELLERAG